MPNLASLNHHFALSNHISFVSAKGDMPVARIENGHARCDIALQGAHILSYQAHQQAPLLWLSEDAKFAVGQSVRGGVPICWPWFGAHETQSEFPAHGFARRTEWKVISTKAMPDGATKIALGLHLNKTTEGMWPYPSRLRCTITVGAQLEIELTTENTGIETFVVSEALHTYFSVGDVSEVILHGLENTHYKDKLTAFSDKKQIDSLSFDAEIDRVYYNTEAECVIEDRQLQRKIYITKSGSASTVVWNPWIERAAQMGDMGEGGYLNMLCVESGNAMINTVTIAPGESHRLHVTYRTETMSAN